MTGIIKERFTAEMKDPFVVFLIGSRVNDIWAVQKWGWAGQQMNTMLAELYKYPEKGFLGGETFFNFFPLRTLLMSYWRSFEDLERFSRAKEDTHFEAWRGFYKRIGYDGSVGIWHETYMIQPNQYEVLYANMPLFGLSAATGEALPVKSHQTRARGRMTGQAVELAPELELVEKH
jgi:hypothetical protein